MFYLASRVSLKFSAGILCNLFDILPVCLLTDGSIHSGILGDTDCRRIFVYSAMNFVSSVFQVALCRYYYDSFQVIS